MEAIIASVRDSLAYLQVISLTDVLDILIVAFFIYKLLGVISRTNTLKVARGVAILLVAMWLSGQLNLTSVNFLLRMTVELGLLALVILFQPELRRLLERMGSGRFSFLLSRESKLVSMDSIITQTALACAEMSKSRTGALIIFERDNRLNDQMSTGTIIDADVTAELIKNIFYPKAPLHDGAMLIRDGRIAAAGCMLPMSGNTNLSRDLGMRHRAGIGMSEHSDAVMAIVSEETGSISVAVEGMLKRHLDIETFEKILRNELIPGTENDSKGTGIFGRKKR